MNSNIIQPEKFDHLHLVYHFTVPLNYGLGLKKVHKVNKFNKNAWLKLDIDKDTD